MGVKDTLLSFLEINYATEKQLVIPSLWVRLIHILCQGVVLGYIIWLLIYQDGYQTTRTGVGSTQTKVKAVSYYELDDGKIEVWDGIDLVTPPKEKDAVFITTSFLPTINQTRTTCVDPKSKCPCAQHEATENGIAVGPSACSDSHCMVFSWCPLERDDSAATHVLNLVDKSTVLIRNSFDIPSFSYSRNNFLDNQPVQNKNFFELADLLRKSNVNFDKDLKEKGGVFAVVIKWRCNADVAQHKCNPKFEVQRLDNPNSSFSSGFNFRYGRFHMRGDTFLRDQYKVNGIRLTFLTDATAKKFDFVKLVISLGTGLGILSFAGFLADLISMWLLPLSPYFRNKKYMNVDEEKKETRRVKWRKFLDHDMLNKAYF